MRSAPLRIWPYCVGLLVAYAVFWRSLANSGDRVLRLWFTSDWLFAASVYKDVFVDKFPLAGIKFQIAPSVFPDLVITTTLMFLTRNAIVTTVLAGMLQFALYAGAYLACYLLVKEPGSRNAGVCLGLLAIALTLKTAAVLPFERDTLRWLLLPESHIASSSLVVLTGALASTVCLDRLRGRRAHLRLGAAAALSFLGALSDLMYVPHMLVAFTLAVLVMMYFHLVRARSSWTVLGVLWLSGALGIVTGRRLFDSGPLSDETGLSLNRSLAAMRTYARGFSHQLLVHDGVHILALLWLAASATWVLHALRARAESRTAAEAGSNRRPLLILIVLFLLISSVGSVVSIIALGMVTLSRSPDYLYAMHYQYPLFFGGLFGLALMADALVLPRLKFLTTRYWAVPALAAILWPSLVLARTPAPATSLGQYRPPLVRGLDRLARRYGLHDGVTGYWEARWINLLSASGLRAAPVVGELTPYHWLSNKYWYLGYPGSVVQHPVYDFAVIDDPLYPMRVEHLTRSLFVSRFGPPAAEETIDGFGVLIYNRPSDEYFRAQFDCSASLQQLIHPLTRPGDHIGWDAWCMPGDVGKVVGHSREAEQGKTPPGYLSYGPYIGLDAGRYVFDIRYESSGPAGKAQATWDAGSFAKDPIIRFCSGVLPPGVREARLPCDVPKQAAGAGFELRVYYTGAGDVRLDHFAIERAGDSQARR